MMDTSAQRDTIAQAEKTGQLRRGLNIEYREREYLKPEEMDRVLKAAKTTGRHGHRNYTLILLTYRHGLRVSEAVNLKWGNVDFNAAQLFVKRLKNGYSSTQPIGGDELRALRKLQRDNPSTTYLFNSERGGGVN